MEKILFILWLSNCILLGSCLGLEKSREYWREKWLKDENKILELEIEIQRWKDDKFNNNNNNN